MDFINLNLHNEELSLLFVGLLAFIIILLLVVLSFFIDRKL